MQTKLRITLGIALCLLIVLTTVASRNVLSSQGDGGRLEGTWEALLTRRNCDTGDPLSGPLPELLTFMSGGTMLDSTSAALPSTKTPGHGVWSHVAGNTYQYSFKFFSFGPPASPTAFTGWAIVSQTLELNSTANEYTSSGTAHFYNTSGGLVGSGCSTTTATRFE
jgi:hypothetical protein